MIPQINIDMILSDPMLLTGAALLVLSPIGFVVAFVKYITIKDSRPREFTIPQEPQEIPEEQFQSVPADVKQPEIPIETVPPPEPEPAPEPATETLEIHQPSHPGPPPSPPKESPKASPMANADKTVVIPPAINDLQAQIEIAFSQIKNLNIKTNDIEQLMDLMARQKEVQLEPNQLKELPMDPADFTKKLLKLAEHVIVLEKEMARLRAGTRPQTPAARANPSNLVTSPQATVKPKPPLKPPIMPL